MEHDKEICEGDTVNVGLFEGRVVRVINWHMHTTYDVDIDGVIDRYPADQVSLVKKADPSV